MMTIKYTSIRILAVLICFAFAQCAPAQNKAMNYKNASSKIKKDYEKGIQFSRKGEDDKAIKAFEKILKKNPSFIDAHIQLGGIFYGSKNFIKAEDAFEKALSIDPNYKPKVYYTLARTEMALQKYQDASDHFSQFLTYPSIPETLKAKAIKYQKNTAFAADAIKNPLPFVPENLGPNINTDQAEYLPCLTADNELFIFTRRFNRQEDLFMAQRASSEWSTAKPIAGINTDENEASQTISADGNTIVFTKCNSRDVIGSCDLFITENIDNKWSEPVNIGQSINSPAWESQPSLSSDGNVLYFASDRKGGKGGRDVWASVRRSDNRWSRPINLGGRINTAENDESPFIHPDGISLYFMSKGHPGMGGSDLFKVDLSDTSSQVLNLGYPINTTGDQGALFVSLDGKKGYYTSDTPQENQKHYGATDIYSFDMPSAIKPNPVTYVKGKVNDLSTKKALVATATIFDVATSKKVSTITTNKNGEFLICLPAGKAYALNIEKESYAFFSAHFDLKVMPENATPYELNAALQPILANTSSNETPTTSEPIVLKNVFFNSGEATLMESSYLELDNLVDLLQLHPTLSIEVQGHTDNVGNETNNQELSNKRAKAVYDYLLSKKIAANRLTYKGYGESVPVADNESEEGRKQNRRTAFLIK